MLKRFVFTYITGVEIAHAPLLDAMFCQLAANT